ncbi:MAG: tetratricopeptide repeat protein, partial [Pseudomonadota bacterium]
TVYFMMGEYGQSLADIEQVLRREPRHWGALAGLSMILVSMDRKRDAIEVMDRALTIHPHLTRMKARRDKLMTEVRGSDI